VTYRPTQWHQLRKLVGLKVLHGTPLIRRRKQWPRLFLEEMSWRCSATGITSLERTLSLLIYVVSITRWAVIIAGFFFYFKSWRLLFPSQTRLDRRRASPRAKQFAVRSTRRPRTCGPPFLPSMRCLKLLVYARSSGTAVGHLALCI